MAKTYSETLTPLWRPIPSPSPKVSKNKFRILAKKTKKAMEVLRNNGVKCKRLNKGVKIILTTMVIIFKLKNIASCDFGIDFTFNTI